MKPVVCPRCQTAYWDIPSSKTQEMKRLHMVMIMKRIEENEQVIAPRIQQTDGVVMSIKSQELKSNGMYVVKYKGPTQTGMVLIYPDLVRYEVFIYNKEGEQLRHDSKTVKDPDFTPYLGVLDFPEGVNSAINK